MTGIVFYAPSSEMAEEDRDRRGRFRSVNTNTEDSSYSDDSSVSFPGFARGGQAKEDEVRTKESGKPDDSEGDQTSTTNAKKRGRSKNKGRKSKSRSKSKKKKGKDRDGDETEEDEQEDDEEEGSKKKKKKKKKKSKSKKKKDKKDKKKKKKKKKDKDDEEGSEEESDDESDHDDSSTCSSSAPESEPCMAECKRKKRQKKREECNKKRRAKEYNEMAKQCGQCYNLDCKLDDIAAKIRQAELMMKEERVCAKEMLLDRHMRALATQFEEFQCEKAKCKQELTNYCARMTERVNQARDRCDNINMRCQPQQTASYQQQQGSARPDKTVVPCPGGRDTPTSEPASPSPAAPEDYGMSATLRRLLESRGEGRRSSPTGFTSRRASSNPRLRR